MKVLVAYASKHGSTEGIARAIAEALERSGAEAVAMRVDELADPAAYDAVVLGSAVYMGSWMKEAAAFARQHQDVLADRPVWLFSSGPLGEDANPDEFVPKEIAELGGSLSPRGHRVFPGALCRDRLGFAEKLAAKAVKAPEGDFRDWQDIRAWSASIAREMSGAAGA